LAITCDWGSQWIRSWSMTAAYSHAETIWDLLLKNGMIAVGSILTNFEGVLTGAPTYRGGLEGLQGSCSLPEQSQ
jgi:hypothetical protein